jgi:hypothetical protein
MNCLWWPCLLMDRDEMSNHYRGTSIYASYQVSIHLAEGFPRRRLKCEKLTDDRRRTPSDGKSSHCLWQGELKKKPSIYGKQMAALKTQTTPIQLIRRKQLLNCAKNVDSKLQKRECKNIRTL